MPLPSTATLCRIALRSIDPLPVRHRAFLRFFVRCPLFAAPLDRRVLALSLRCAPLG
jgi:hypothetical protein